MWVYIHLCFLLQFSDEVTELGRKMLVKLSQTPVDIPVCVCVCVCVCVWGVVVCVIELRVICRTQQYRDRSDAVHNIRYLCVCVCATNVCNAEKMLLLILSLTLREQLQHTHTEKS